MSHKDAGAMNDLWREVYAFEGEGSVYATQLRLLPSGWIGGYEHPNERWWLRNGDHLEFRDGRGRLTTRFSPPNADGVRVGRFAHTGPLHSLTPVAPIHRHAQRKDAVDAKTSSSQRLRRDLVILRAGPNSCHPAWTDDLPDEERSWDLCVSTFGGAQFTGRDAGEYTVEQDRFGKFRSIWSLLHADSIFWRYDFIMLCDDDIALKRSDLETTFWKMREYDLLIGQPSLASESFILHPVTRTAASSGVRLTDFVELMLPVFRSWALHLVVPAFADATVGYGLDHLWRFLIGNQPGRMGIIDEVSVRHTRPPQTTYSPEIALMEQDRLQKLYRFVPRCNGLGSLGATG